MHKPIRMCINCRKRFYQEELNRFQCENKNLILFKGEGRSFYICNSCINNNNTIKKLTRLCKTEKEIIKKNLRSLLENKSI